MSGSRKITYIAFCFLLVLSCAYKPPYKVDYDKLPPEIKVYYPIEKALSARLWALSTYGMPMFAGDINRSSTVFDVQDLFVRSYPRQEEIWWWSTFKCSFYHLGSVGLSYTTSHTAELQLSIQDTCSKSDYFCIEFRIDGLKREHNTTLYKFQIVFQNPKTKKWVYLYDTSPIVGETGLTGVDVSFFMDIEAVQQRIFSDYKHSVPKAVKIPVLIIVWDFRAKEKREAVFELGMERR